MAKRTQLDMDAVEAAVERKPSSLEARAQQIVSTPVRLSVDLDRTAYHGLVSWCQGIAMKVGRVKVNHVWVLRELVWELFEDEKLQQRIIERVRDRHGPDAM